jgi:hypothetical protein
MSHGQARNQCAIVITAKFSPSLPAKTDPKRPELRPLGHIEHAPASAGARKFAQESTSF